METLTIILIVAGFLLLIGLSIWYSAREVEKPLPPVEYPTMKGSYSTLELEILKMINQVRTVDSTNRVAPNDIASLLEETHIMKCMRYQKVSHDGVNERFSDLREMLSVKSLGEIVVYGHKSPENLIEKLLSSESHKKILLGNFNQVGISTKVDSDGKMYVGLMFMR